MHKLIFAVATAALVLPAAAFFNLDERYMGPMTKTVLADGRLQYTIVPKNMEPFRPPEYEGVKMKPSANGPEDDAAYITARMNVTMKAHWKTIDVSKHAEEVRCHDAGDRNMRLSLFGVSDELRAALTRAPTSVVLYAPATHRCHGDPIFRHIDTVVAMELEERKSFWSSKPARYNARLITSKGSYERIFDDADIHLDIKHPVLTRVSSDPEVVETRNRLGLNKDNYEDHAESVTMALRSAADGSAHPSRPSSNRNYEVIDMTPKRRRAVASSHEFQQLCWICDAWDSVTGAVSNAVASIGNVIGSAVSAVVNGCLEAVKGIARSLMDLLSITVNWNKTLGFSLSRSGNYKIWDVNIYAYFNFGAGFKFILNIYQNSFKEFKASVYGSVNLQATATYDFAYNNNNKQSTLFTIPGPTVTFAIGPLPVWIASSFPIVAGYTYGVTIKANLKAAFSLSAYCEYGLHWTSGAGWQPIATNQFNHDHAFTYPTTIVVTGSAYAGAQAVFNLYSMINGWAMLQLGASATITSQNPSCSIKATANFFITISAGGGIDIEVLHFTIYKKNFGSVTIFNYQKQFLNVCTPKISLSQLYSSLSLSKAAILMNPAPTSVIKHHDFHQLDAANFTNASFISFNESDSGKTWHTAYTCPNSNPVTAGWQYTTQVTGFFLPKATIFWVQVSRNVSTGNGTTALVMQGHVMSIPTTVKLGMNATLTLLDYSKLDNTTYADVIQGFRSMEVTSHDQNVTDLPMTQLNVHWSESNPDEITLYNEVAFCGVPPVAKTLVISPDFPAPSAEMAALLAIPLEIIEGFVNHIVNIMTVISGLVAIQLFMGLFAPCVKFYREMPMQRREKMYGVGLTAGIVVAFLCFVAGASLEYAVIQGVYTPPQTSNGTSVPLQTIIWQFAGMKVVEVNCVQSDPSCSPNCVDQCTATTRAWGSVNWPYCPPQGCHAWAYDAIIYGIVFFVTGFFGFAACIYIFKSVMRRMLFGSTSVSLAALFIYTLWQRIQTFTNEIFSNFFAPAASMQTPYTLQINSWAVSLWQTGVFLMFVVAAVAMCLAVYECYVESRAMLLSELHEPEPMKEQQTSINNGPLPTQRADKSIDEAL